MSSHSKPSLRLLALGALAAVTFALPAFAQVQPATPAAPMTAEATAVKKLLEQKFPNAQVKNVAKSGYFGLYEAQFEGQMVYTDPKVTYILVGSVYDTTTKENLTENKLRSLNRIAWDSLPFDLAMKKVKGNGSRKLAIFSDADCPFCARLENELKSVDDVTIYTFLFPIDQLHPDSGRKSKAIWCSPDKVKAWDEFFASGKVPDNKGDCDNPLEATHVLGEQLRVNATPTLVFADGSIVPGALPKDRLEAQMTQSDAEMKKPAAAKK
jgi:thiol:disulfide interchange protein DsbC